jgi:hypothetical protein
MASAENVAVAAPLVSVVVPCCGMLEYTKLCVPNMLRWGERGHSGYFLRIGAGEARPRRKRGGRKQGA